MKLLRRWMASLTASVSVILLNIMPVLAVPAVPIEPAVEPAVDDLLNIDHPFKGLATMDELIQETVNTIRPSSHSIEKAVWSDLEQSFQSDIQDLTNDEEEARCLWETVSP